MNIEAFGENISCILKTPPDVTLVAAVKTRTPEEVETAVRTGITCGGHNYVQEAARMIMDVDYEVQ